MPGSNRKTPLGMKRGGGAGAGAGQGGRRGRKTRGGHGSPSESPKMPIQVPGGMKDGGEAKKTKKKQAPIKRMRGGPAMLKKGGDASGKAAVRSSCPSKGL